jgi:GABA(A) receptor-associated protein
MSSTFKQKYDFQLRRDESTKILNKYPNRLPIIIERSKKCSLNEINKNKFLIPDDLTIGQFLMVIRKRIVLENDESLFLFINDTILPATSQILSSIYNEHKDEDGFLYITYCSENTFGNNKI